MTGQTLSPVAATDAAALARQAVMAVAVRAHVDELRQVLELVQAEDVADIRRAEIGLVMVRGRAGGGGLPFNAGEATVTRATIALASGETGFGYVLGRDKARARLVAIVDALGQNPALAPMLEDRVLAPVRVRLAAEGRANAAQTAATRVDFFTMVRGE